jgi:outer membrane receptor protein involved in Fe transport
MTTATASGPTPSSAVAAPTFESNTHDQERSGFGVVNVSVGYRWGQWTGTLRVRHAFNEAYEKRVFYFANAGLDWTTTRYESPADPRQIGATLRYSF